jgi:hypothetical protein
VNDFFFCFGVGRETVVWREATHLGKSTGEHACAPVCKIMTFSECDVFFLVVWTVS